MKISFEGSAIQVMREMEQIVDRHEKEKQPVSQQSDDVIASALRSLSFYKDDELEAELKKRNVKRPFAPFVGSLEQCQAVIRGAKTEDLQAELFRRDAITPAPREVKFGPVTDAECDAAYKAWLVFFGNAMKSMRPVLEEFARSRGVL